MLERDGTTKSQSGVSSASRIGNELLHGEDEADRMTSIKEFKNNKSNIEYWESKHKIEANESQGDYIARRDRELENMAAYSKDVGGDIKKAEKMYTIEKEVLAERHIDQLANWKNKSEKAQYEAQRAGAQKYAAQIAKLSEQYSASDLRGTKRDDAVREHKAKLMNAGLDDAQAGGRAEKIVNQIKQFKGWT